MTEYRDSVESICASIVVEDIINQLPLFPSTSSKHGTAREEVSEAEEKDVEAVPIQISLTKKRDEQRNSPKDITSRYGLLLIGVLFAKLFPLTGKGLLPPFLPQYPKIV